MKRHLRTAIVAASAAVALPGPSAAAHDGAARGSAVPESVATPTQATQLAEARAATARYHHVETAIADGYRPSEQCVASPSGVMGRHYVHPDRVGSIDPRRPAMLLYVPASTGRLRLVGVEYFQVDADQDLTTDDDRPSVFGRSFDGPMPGHQPGMPVHYDLHVWLWAHNPAGMFAPWNPALSC